ncbi:MAG: PAS domain-containing protein [Desulfobacterales bacterium]|nr:PAS domain-containing protein [Desulfobacterales bacterium]
MQHYCPAAVLTNDKGDILYISGRTGKYLEPAAGKANWNIFAMAREGLRYELNNAWQKALRQKTAASLKGVKVGTNGGVQAVDITVQPIAEPAALQGMVMIVFTDVATPPETKAAGNPPRASGGSDSLAALERELQQAREEIQTCREEMQTSQEELKSTNEELQSTNEELQSTNEELTTSKEEMQSLNEELQTVNHELQAKVDELSRANNDMKNLLNSTDIATLFLDDALNVRRFTTQTASIIKLIAGDVGRPITDITTDLDYPEMVADAREVLRTLVFIEKQVATRDGRWFLVRIMPYRTLENRIDGVVITFSNITEAKTLEAQLRQIRPRPKNGAKKRRPHEKRHDPFGGSRRPAPPGGSAAASGRDERRPGPDRGRCAAARARTAGPPDRAGDAKRGVAAVAGGGGGGAGALHRALRFCPGGLLDPWPRRGDPPGEPGRGAPAGGGARPAAGSAFWGFRPRAGPGWLQSLPGKSICEPGERGVRGGAPEGRQGAAQRAHHGHGFAGRAGMSRHDGGHHRAQTGGSRGEAPGKLPDAQPPAHR